jgi:hypothetical protein
MEALPIPGQALKTEPWVVAQRFWILPPMCSLAPLAAGVLPAESVRQDQMRSGGMEIRQAAQPVGVPLSACWCPPPLARGEPEVSAGRVSKTEALTLQAIQVSRGLRGTRSSRSKEKKLGTCSTNGQQENIG